MPYKFSTKSLDRLFTCHPDLQKIANEVIKTMDISVLWGHRGQVDQEKAFNNGFSKCHFPMSKHNRSPSRAIDIAPWPYDDKNIPRYLVMGGKFMQAAAMLKEQGKISHDIRWLGDPNGDNNPNPDGWDFAHFELI